MFECWARIGNEWIAGWDCGKYKSTGATCFRPEHDMSQVYYIAEEDLSYSKQCPQIEEKQNDPHKTKR